MGPNVSGKSDPILPSSVVIASGNPGSGSGPRLQPFAYRQRFGGIKDLLPTIDKAKLEKRVRPATRLFLFSRLFPQEARLIPIFIKRSSSCQVTWPNLLTSAREGSAQSVRKSRLWPRSSSCEEISREVFATLKSPPTGTGTRCTGDRKPG